MVKLLLTSSSLFGLSLQAAVAFHYEVYELPPNAGDEFSWARAISQVNGSGQAYVVGTSKDDNTGATIAMRWLVDADGLVSSSTIPLSTSFDISEGLAVSDYGSDAGGFQVETSGLPAYVGYRTDNSIPSTYPIGPISPSDPPNNDFFTTMTTGMIEAGAYSCGYGMWGGSLALRVDPGRAFRAQYDNVVSILKPFDGAYDESITPTDATSINNDAYVVGSGPSPDSTFEAYLWTDESDRGIRLGYLDNNGASSVAYSISDAGQICGMSNGLAFLQDDLTPSSMYQIETVSEGASEARDVNNNGWVIGNMLYGATPYYPWVYPGFGGGFDIMNMSDLPMGVELTGVYSINDAGWIVGEGTDTTYHLERKAYLLIPIND